MDLGLTERHVLVAGASRGLGFAFISSFLAEVMKVTAKTLAITDCHSEA